MTGYTHRPETALDDLIAEQAMDNHIRARRADDYDDLIPEVLRRARHHGYCRRCGGWNSHHPMCDAQ